MFFTWPSKIRAKGILGMNKRNVSYISRYNPRHLYPYVDNKLKTKIVAEKYNVATTKLLGVVEYQYQVRELGRILEPYQGFAIKPAQGSGGKGILVISGKRNGLFVKTSGEELSLNDVMRHVSNTLSGLHSLGGKPDVSMIESLVNFAPVFDNYSYEGIPDIRMIVFKGYPVMAMLRLSTHASDGKANLHQGAVGVGLDLGTGKALLAVQKGRPIQKHPDTGFGFDSLQVPDWEVILHLASSCYEMTGLGYLGADIVLDKEVGPLLLELNARPGLAIQVANGIGLVPRLKKVEGIQKPHTSVEDRVSFSKAHFSM